MRKLLSKITSPIFVPLRRLVVWGDKTFGTCDMKLTIEPRYDNPLRGFADIDEGTSSTTIKEAVPPRSRLSFGPPWVPSSMSFAPDV